VDDIGLVDRRGQSLINYIYRYLKKNVHGAIFLSGGEKWVHFLGPPDGKMKVDSFGYAAFFIPAGVSQYIAKVADIIIVI